MVQQDLSRTYSLGHLRNLSSLNLFHIAYDRAKPVRSLREDNSGLICPLGTLGHRVLFEQIGNQWAGDVPVAEDACRYGPGIYNGTGDRTVPVARIHKSWVGTEYY